MTHVDWRMLALQRGIRSSHATLNTGQRLRDWGKVWMEVNGLEEVRFFEYEPRNSRYHRYLLAKVDGEWRAYRWKPDHHGGRGLWVRRANALAYLLIAYEMGGPRG